MKLKRGSNNSKTCDGKEIAQVDYNQSKIKYINFIWYFGGVSLLKVFDKRKNQKYRMFWKRNCYISAIGLNKSSMKTHKIIEINNILIKY